MPQPAGDYYDYNDSDDHNDDDDNYNNNAGIRVTVLLRWVSRVVPAATTCL